jgi:outer membrane protein assembly factor BamD
VKFVQSTLLKRAPLVLALVAAVSVSACGTVRKKNKTDLSYQERPVELLYNAGSRRLDQHEWGAAVVYLREVERQHPYSEWSRRAILMQAYAHYEAGQYDEAIADADRFAQLYPGNASAPYAYYIKAICYFERILDVGRDQASTGQALNALREVTVRYPTTEYAADARLKMDMVNDQLAGKEMTVGRFYLRQNQPLAAMNRFKTVVEKYQTTSHTPEALYRLVESDLTVGLFDEAKRNAAVLGANFPGDPWYQRAYDLMNSHGLRPPVGPSNRKSLGQKLGIS